MDYNLLINVVYWGYNPLTNLLLPSWDIQVSQNPPSTHQNFIQGPVWQMSSWPKRRDVRIFLSAIASWFLDQQNFSGWWVAGRMIDDDDDDYYYYYYHNRYHHSSCIMHHSSCIIHHASCIMNHSSCIMHHASCIIIMHHASCIMHHHHHHHHHLVLVDVVETRPGKGCSGTFSNILTQKEILRTGDEGDCSAARGRTHHSGQEPANGWLFSALSKAACASKWLVGQVILYDQTQSQGQSCRSKSSWCLQDRIGSSCESTCGCRKRCQTAGNPPTS